jgi:hypothetical protein
MNRAQLAMVVDFLESVRDCHDCTDWTGDGAHYVRECWKCWAKLVLKTVRPRKRAARRAA